VLPLAGGDPERDLSLSIELAVALSGLDERGVAVVCVVLVMALLRFASQEEAVAAFRRRMAEGA
jgi:hypothetical protein